MDEVKNIKSAMDESWKVVKFVIEKEPNEKKVPVFSPHNTHTKDIFEERHRML